MKKARQTVLVGNSAPELLTKEILQINPKRLLLVRGQSSYQACGAKGLIEKILKNLEIEICEFFDFNSNPEFGDLNKGLCVLNEFSPDLIIAIGGGSVLDMAKLMRFFSSHRGIIEKNEYEYQGNQIPLIAIPTTAGTGSEVTPFAVLYKNKVKYSVEHHAVIPNIAVEHAPLTYANPPYLSACTGFDALAQAIESYWNLNATKESDEYATKAIDLIWSNLPKVVNSPTPDSRNKMMEGAYWAGKAISITKTTAPHAFSYPFTTYYGYPHGHAVAITFPSIFRYNMLSGDIPNCKGEYLLRALEINWDEDTLNRYIEKIGLKVVSQKYDVNLLLGGINLNRLSNNPAFISEVDCVRLLEESLKA